jgi:hypothetical protein
MCIMIPAHHICKCIIAMNLRKTLVVIDEKISLIKRNGFEIVCV